MVLRKHSRLQPSERSYVPGPEKLICCKKMAAGIVDPSPGERQTGPHFRCAPTIVPNFSMCCPAKRKVRGARFLQSTQSDRRARLLAEVVALVSGRSQHHLRRSLCRDIAAHHPRIVLWKVRRQRRSRSVSAPVVSRKSLFGVTGRGSKKPRNRSCSDAARNGSRPSRSVGGNEARIA